MSLKPAIGNTWLEKYHHDLAHGYLVTKEGNKAKIPRTYMKKIKETEPELHEQILTRKTQHRAFTPTDRNTEARLRDAEKIHKAKPHRRT